MIRFMDISSITQGMIGVVVVAQFFYAVMHFAINIKRKNVVNILILLPEIILLYCEFQFISAIKNVNLEVTFWFNEMAKRFAHIPVWCLILFMQIIFVLEILQTIEYRFWRKNHITNNSIKEAMDNLPTGVCYFRENGRIILKNRSMEKICRSLSGKPLLNGCAFQKIIHEKMFYLGNSASIITPENIVYSVKEEIAWYEDQEIYILVTLDITEQYAKMQSLTEKQQAVQQLNEQLVEYGKEIVSNINAREILNAKVKIHDELGMNLLAMKKYILKGGTEEELKNIKDGLVQNVQYLRHEVVEDKKDEYKVILETAEKLNVRINVRGDFPTEQPVKHILVTGIHECLTNTIRHAHGNEMTVEVRKTENELTAKFTNNGERPKGEIAEKGGLASLRTLVENNKGTMKLYTKEQFILTISFPIVSQ